MIKMSKISLSRLSSGITAFVCAGFLVNAIMTNNGSSPGERERWKNGQKNSHSFVDSLGRKTVEEWQSNRRLGVDPATTSSVPLPETQTSKQPSARPSVMSLIRENSDVAPAVSSGTNRVSVIVKPGDTVFAIARRHGLTVNELAALNALEEPFVIRVGQTLYVAR